MDGLAAFLKARLDEDEAAANAACEPDVSRNGEWIAYPHPPGRKDRRQNRAVQLVGAGPDESSWTVCEVGQWDRAPMVAAHIARHDPARALREVAVKRVIISTWEGWPDYDLPPGVHDGRDDSERSRDEATKEALEAVVAGIATIWSEHPDYRPEWKP